MRVLLTIVVSILFLSACGTIDLIETQEQSVGRTELDLSPAEPLDLDDRPNWIVITPDNADDVFEYLREEGYEPVIFGLTDRGYEKLSVDFTKIRQHINNQRRIVLQYKQYYEGPTTSESQPQ